MNAPRPFGRPVRREAPDVDDASRGYRSYGELARWWPLISPPEEYREEAGFIASVLETASIPVHDVLELGSGGGSNAFHLKTRFNLTLVDLSDEMLDVSRRLNPELHHYQGDMRTVRLNREFDAVFVHDAIDYMIDEVSLHEAIKTAHVHCRPGGIVLLMPDSTSERYGQSSDCGGIDASDGRGARYLDWAWDPDPSDSWTQTEYVFLLREPGRTVRVVHESHRIGLFSRELWLRFLREAGFEPEAVLERTSDSRTPREIFVGRRLSRC